MSHSVHNNGNVPNHYNSFSVILQDTVIGSAISAISIGMANTVSRRAPFAAVLLTTVPFIAAAIWLVRRILGIDPSSSSGSSSSSLNNNGVYHMNVNPPLYAPRRIDFQEDNRSFPSSSLPSVIVIQGGSQTASASRVHSIYNASAPSSTTFHETSIIGEPLYRVPGRNPSPVSYPQVIPTQSVGPISYPQVDSFSSASLPNIRSGNIGVPSSGSSSSRLNPVGQRPVQFKQVLPQRSATTSSSSSGSSFSPIAGSRIAAALGESSGSNPQVIPGASGSRLNSVPKRDK